jgi:TonB family protein
MATIFLGDRDEAYRRSLAHALRRRGDEVLEFSSGAELYARAVASPPDLVVLETELDELDGFQVFSKLHRERPNNPLPVVFVAEFEHPRVVRVVKQRGALGYLGKGRDLDHVVDEVRKYARREGRDPLDGRTLSAAVAWLQSRGKSGRLEVEANGTSGYVLLHHGRILEARWGDLSGDSAVSTIAENLDRATFRFAEGVDELEAPRARPAASQRAASEPLSDQVAGPEELRRALAEALSDQGPDSFPRIDESRPAAEGPKAPDREDEPVDEASPTTVEAPAGPAAARGSGVVAPTAGPGSVAEMVRRALREAPEEPVTARPPEPASEADAADEPEPGRRDRAEPHAAASAPASRARDAGAPSTARGSATDTPVTREDGAHEKVRRPDRARDSRHRRGPGAEPAVRPVHPAADAAVEARPAEPASVPSRAAAREEAGVEVVHDAAAAVPAGVVGQAARGDAAVGRTGSDPAASGGAGDVSTTPAVGSSGRQTGASTAPATAPDRGGADLRRLATPHDLRVPVPGERPPEADVFPGEKRIEAPSPSGSRRVPSRRPSAINPAVGGAVAAALELRLAWEQEAEEVRRHRSNRRRSLAVAAMIALLVALGVAFAAIFPGSVPQALAGILGTLGISDERDSDPVTQLARAGEDELDAAFDRVDGVASDPGDAEGGAAADEDVPPARAAAAAGAPDAAGGVGAADGSPNGASDASDAAGRETTDAAAPATDLAAAGTPAQPDRPPAAAERAEPDPAAERAARLAEQRRREELAERRARQRALEQQRALERQRAAEAAAEAEEPAAETVAETPPVQRETAPPVNVAAADPEPRREAPPPSRAPVRAEPRVDASGAGAGDDNPAVVKPVLLSRGRDPYYPPELRTQNIGGSVLLNIRVGSNGRAQRVEIRRSSGYEALDQAAVAAVGTFLWDPARGDAGPTEAWVTQAVTFRP